MKRLLGWLLALISLTAVGVCCCIKLQESELGHRTAFYKALVNNGDLNIVNQVPDPDRWLVTRTYNHPTHQGNGIVTLWYPFYEYARALLPRGFAEERFIFDLNGFQVAAILRDVFFLLLSLVLMSSHFRQTPRTPVVLLLLATPILWYVFFEPFRVEVTALAVATVLAIGVGASLRQPLAPRRLFFLGLGVGVAYTVVSAFALYCVPILGKIALRRQRPFSCLAALASGLAIPVGLDCVNSFLHSGAFLPFSYPRIVGLACGSTGHWLETFTRADSFLLSSPVHFLLLAGMLALLARARPRFGGSDGDDRWMLALVPLVFSFEVVAFDSCIPARVDEMPSRMFLYVLPVLTGFLGPSAGPVWRRRPFVLGALLLACIFVNWLNLAQYDVRGMLVEHVPAREILAAFGQDLSKIQFLHPSRLGELLKLAFFLPAFVLLSSLLWLLSGASAAAGKVGAAAAVALALGYGAVTLLNFRHNRANVQALLDGGFFRSSVVSSGPELDVYDEVMSTLENGTSSLPASRAQENSEVRAAYLRRAMTEVAVDPIGFKRDWEAGHPRPSVWNFTAGGSP